MSPPPTTPHTIVHGFDLDAAYATAIQASSKPPQITVSDEERRRNPFMLSHEAEQELEEHRRKSKEEGRGGVVSPLEVEEIKKKYVQVLGYMEKLQREGEGVENRSGGEQTKG